MKSLHGQKKGRKASTNLRKGFVAYSDASHIWLGYVLLYEGKVVAYASKQLMIHDQNYPTYDMELATTMFALKI
ncbi:Retrotransposable element Tf2 [Gossypium australe]|uniref:Retrotransposable element Tf2 n=1 Tax=Gossypium australe TaxID=47621 RepID=A0A5B6UVA9_9ROSI|nr:Retrotransposable element Tf2 [Gossypium australe]